MTRYVSAGCACKCACLAYRVDGANGLCSDCWREWNTGSRDHEPVADNSYMGTYGIAGVWTGWLISQGAGHLVAESPAALQGGEYPPTCPSCPYKMVSRPGAWKCYRHDEPIVILKRIAFPRSPDIAVDMIPQDDPSDL